mgnify:FL=1
MLNKSEQSFKINGSWSHTILNREEIDFVGWFDERFLGVGEEDGDMEWRWQNKFGKNFVSFQIPGIVNHVEHKDCLENLKIVNNKYSKFNYDFSHIKYKEDKNGFNYGIMNRKLICVSETPHYHIGEKFYWENKENL